MGDADKVAWRAQLERRGIVGIVASIAIAILEP
jgi:hypothetical protein